MPPELRQILLKNLCTKGVRVVRVMPNTPALVGEGAAAVAGGSCAKADDVKLTRAIFDAVASASKSKKN